MAEHEGLTIEHEAEQEKSVADRIIDKFAKDVKEEKLFNSVADKVILAVKQKRLSKKDLSEIIAEDENKES